jgi:predicted ATPase
MKLARLRVRNFRCYKDEIAFDFENLTAFIGKNDVGKSTVMDALDIFLNDGTPDKNDACVTGDGKDLTIICEFSDLPMQAIIDENYFTTFEDEYLTNQNGHLEIHKTYSGHTQTPKCTSVSVYALHPNVHGASDLLLLKNADLKKRANDLGVDLSGTDVKVNSLIRQRMWESCSNLELQTKFIPLEENNGKKVWEGIKSLMPSFALFKSDRASTDQDPEAQDPLKAAVREAIKQKEAELTSIANYIQNEVKQIAAKTVAKLGELDANLAKELNPQFTPPKWESLFKASIVGDEGIPINKRGSGVKRLILLSFFRAKVEQEAATHTSSSVIYGIEEPETSQHPHNQRMLVSALMDLSTDNQVIITTHTPVLARVLPDNCLRYIHFDDKTKIRTVMSGGASANSMLVNALGVLPDNNIKLFIGVEGANDIEFFKTLSRVLRSHGEDVLDLTAMELAGEVVFFPLGGSSLALWVSRLEPLNRPEFHLFDRDCAPPAQAKYQSVVDSINSRQRCKALSTKRKEIENYLHYEAINEAYEQLNLTLGFSAPFNDFDDVPVIVAERVHSQSNSQTPWASLDEETKSKKVSKAKRNLNTLAVAHMTLDRIAEADPNGEIKHWFHHMKELSELDVKYVV